MNRYGAYRNVEMPIHGVGCWLALLIPLIVIVSGAWSCRKDAPPQPYVRSIEIEALDASCTEAWLRVTFTQATTDSILLTRDNQTLQTLRFSTQDSVLIDEGLLPNRTYEYKAYRLNDSRLIDSSTQVTLRTLDTTSHNFTWEIDTLGDGGGSVLYDVAIINDTLVYAVGEIMVRDSSGNWINPPYNIAKWNGQRWELMRQLHDCRLYYPTCGPSYFLYAPARSIFAFGPNDIWVAVGTAQHWDGVRWTEHAGILGVGDAYKIWGTSSSNLYFVGYNGFIAHYSSGTWRRVESGTTLHLYDVWGNRNFRTGEIEILAVGSNWFVNFERIILRLNSTVTVLSDSGINWPLSSVWFIPERHYYVVGSGIYEKINLAEPRWRNGPLDITTFSTYSIRGSGLNDIYVAGAYGELLHFNGMSWRSFRAQTGLSNGQYSAVAARGNKVFAVGYDYPRAVVAKGERMP